MSVAATYTEDTQRSRPAGKQLLRARLRQETGDAHRRLDERLGQLDLCLPRCYRQFLQATAAALLPLEGALMSAGVVRILPDWERRSRRRAILADLRKLGERPQVARQVTLDFHNILGVVYVLEGSRLGGRVLLGKAMQSGDPVVRSATAYLRHGAHEPFWSSFLAILEHEGRSLCHEGRVVDGARLAFRLFEESAARFAGTTA